MNNCRTPLRGYPAQEGLVCSFAFLRDRKLKDTKKARDCLRSESADDAVKSPGPVPPERVRIRVELVKPALGLAVFERGLPRRPRRKRSFAARKNFSSKDTRSRIPADKDGANAGGRQV